MTAALNSANDDPSTLTRLVADVGGTNIRLALSSPGGAQMSEVAKLSCDQFNSLEEALQCYLDGLEHSANVREACLAVAGPVNAAEIAMTNLPWRFSRDSLRSALQVDRLEVINDFAAVAYALPNLRDDEVIQLGGHTNDANAPRLAIGPGTGLGVALCVPAANKHLCFPSEGGHATISAQTPEERAIVEFHSAPNAPHREHIISGRGLLAIYQGLGGTEDLTPADISQRGASGVDALCEQSLRVFCEWLGSICGDQALSSGALGGVYIAGGMVKQFLPFLQTTAFRERFENKGNMRGYLSEIPCYVISRDHVALLGSASVTL